MTNTNKKSKNTRKLLGAIGMLTVSAAMLVSSTFAWFTMNKEVKATNMQVRALAEDGLLINEEAAPGSYWDEEATAAQTASSKLAMLHPASTADGTTWYHAASTKYDDAAAAGSGTKSSNLVNNAYDTLGTLTAITDMSNDAAAAGSQAAFETMGATATSAAGYYVHYRYYLKTSAQSAITLDGSSKYVSIKSVVATPTTASGSGSATLDKSLRVGIKLNNTFYIYNPLNGTSEYYVNASTKTTTIAGNTATITDLASLPAVSANGTPVDVYLWFEGEDENCKSSNATAATLDNIKVDITFSLTGAEDVPTA